MPAKLNTLVYHRALGAAHSGSVDDGEWNAPEKCTRRNCLLDNGDGTFRYPIFTGDGRLSARGVLLAMSGATTNREQIIIPAISATLLAISSRGIQYFSADDIDGGGNRSRTTMLYLLSNVSGFDEADSEKIGQPAVVNGLPAFYYWKELAHAGTFHNANAKKPFSITFDVSRLSRLADTGNAMIAAGADIPIVCDHQETARANLGYMRGFKSENGKLYGLCQFLGDDSLNTAMKNRVSVGIDENYVDGTGREWGDVVRHVAVTPLPVIPNQEQFVKAASRAAAAGSALLLSAAHEEIETMDKPNLLPCSEAQLNSLHQAVPGLVGVAPDGKSDHLIKHLSAVGAHVKKLCRTLGMNEPAAGSDDVQNLSLAVDTAVAKLANPSPRIATLSAAESEMYADRADLYRQKIDLAVASGDVDPTIANELKAKLPADPKTGGVFLLSRANDSAGFDGRPIDFILGLFSGKKLFARNPERTRVQMLSRAVPSDGPESDKSPVADKDNPFFQAAAAQGLLPAKI